MPALVVGGVTIPRVTAAPRTVVEAIDRERAFDNTMLAVQIAASKESWAITVSNATAAQRTTILAALVGTPPVTCSGNLLGGTVSCHIEIQSDEPVLGILPTVYNISFILHRA